jgi:lauroyl/myristoyl acyltransferase
MLSQAETVTFMPALMCAAALPLPLAYRAARQIGHIAATLDTDLWAACIRRLVRRLEVTNAEAERIALRLFELKYCDDLDARLLPGFTRDTVQKLISYQGIENLNEALAQGRGAVLYCGHVWSSRMCVTALALLGYRLVLVRRKREVGSSDNPMRRWLYERAQRFFEASGGRVLASGHDEGSVEMGALCVKALRRNEIVVVKPDIVSRRNVRLGDIGFRFLNGQEIFRPGGAMIAWAAGSPLLSLGIHRDPGRIAVRAVIGAPLEPTPNVRATLAAQVAEIEAEVRSDPACWRTWLTRRRRGLDPQQQAEYLKRPVG